MSLSVLPQSSDPSNPFRIYETGFSVRQPVSRGAVVPFPPHQVPVFRYAMAAAPIQPRDAAFSRFLTRFLLVILSLLLVLILLPPSWQKPLLASVGLRRSVAVALPHLLPERPESTEFSAVEPESSRLPFHGALLPVRYVAITSPFGLRWGRMHQGIDLAAAYGQKIRAVNAGRVIHSGWESGYGNSVVLDHGHGLQTRYAHCSRVLVSPGQSVRRGDVIARVGSTGHSTGPHLHFEVLMRGYRRNPAQYFNFVVPGSRFFVTLNRARLFDRG